jgi:hypothetical protein
MAPWERRVRRDCSIIDARWVALHAARLQQHGAAMAGWERRVRRELFVPAPAIALHAALPPSPGRASRLHGHRP